MQFEPVFLKKDNDRRLRSGHCWIYSNEIDTGRTPLKSLEAGQAVDVFDHREKWLGSGYVNPHSLICARIVSRDRSNPLGRSLMVHRFKVALSLRERLFATPYYRLVYGESDGLPGLVVDRYGEVLVVQINTAGMERLREEVLNALVKVIKPECIILRNDSVVRKSEGLELGVEVPIGIQPEFLEIEERGCRFQANVLTSQKTGWYFDQAANRRQMCSYVAGARVLDICSYIGAWGIQAATAGASEVFCVDSSASALDRVQANAALNDVTEKIAVIEGDAFDALRELRSERQRFDAIILDPPAFIKRRKDINEGSLAYRRLNQAAMQLLSRDGLLFSSTCSHHMSGEYFLRTLQRAGRHLDRSLQLLFQGAQSPDHPVHPAIPETAYLKSLFLRVLPSF